MALTIYGSPRSRTMRVLWTAAELGLDYAHVPLAFDDPVLKEPDFVRINPAGAIPAIVDDGFALSESLAINLYLAKKNCSGGPAPLYPATLHGEAEIWRGSLWAQGHLEPWVQGDALLQGAIAAAQERARPFIAKALAHLDAVLARRNWLVSDHFTIGDLNVAAVLSPSRAAKLPMADYPAVQGWLARCYGRPAALATRQRFAGPAPAAKE